MMKTILSRTSVRAYEDRPIEDEKMEQLLRAAMAAPSACNLQPWRFVVVKSRETLTAMSAQFSNMPMAEKAAAAIVVCADMEHTLPEEGQTYWIQDAAAATENILLAAHEMGLGAVWCGIYPRMERVESLKTLLKLPAGITPFCVIPMGYPAESRAPKDKWHPENIHYEVW
jgi:nitroreductase